MTREEAIKIIRLTCPKISDSECDFETAMRFLIPELRESADERIRKEITDFLETIPASELKRIPRPISEWFAWLEKQKEPENTSASTMIPSCWAKEPSLQKEQKPVEPSGKLSREEYLYQLLIDQLITYSDYEYLTGKKPVGWSEDKDFDDCLTELVCELYEQRDESPENTAFRECEILKKWTPILLKKAQQKQEWSDEDRRIMDGIQLVLESWDRTHSSIAGLPSLIPSYISWLKARRPQSKQKRQIKEGDKVSIHCRKDRKEGIITIYDGKVGEVIHVWDAKRNPWGHIGVRLDNGCNHGFYEDELEVLDEFSWKPSEEQMEYLNDAIDNYREENNDEAVDVLKELRKELKKLM